MKPPPSAFPDGQAAIDRLRASSCAVAMQVDEATASVSSIALVKLGAMAIVERPNRFRVDLTAFGQPAATLASDGNVFTFVDARNDTRQVVPATETALQSTLGVAVAPNVVVALVLGRATVLVHTLAPQIRWQGGRYLVTIASTHGWRETLALVPRKEDWNKPWSEQRLRLLGVRVEKTDGVLYDATLADHALAATARTTSSPLSNPALDAVLGVSPVTAPSGPPCDDTEIPMTVEIASGGRSITLHEKKVAINPPIQRGVFRPRAERASSPRCSPRTSPVARR